MRLFQNGIRFCQLMKRTNAVLFSPLMIVSFFAGCIGGEEVDTSEYEDQIAEFEEMLEAQNQTIAQRDATIDGLEDGCRMLRR